MGDEKSEIGNLSPHKAFATIGNEFRIEILRVLWERRPDPIAFTDLYKHIDVEDTGQFNYHLSKLLDHFVDQTDDGYVLMNAGREVVLAILADVQTENPLSEPVIVGVSCYHCEAMIEAWYEDGWIRIECSACEQIYAGHPFPSAGLQNRTVEQILTVFDTRLRHLFSLATEGICPSCSAEMILAPHYKPENEFGPEVAARFTCDHCGSQYFSPVGLIVIDHPDVVQFHLGHSIDLSTKSLWELEWCYNGANVEVQSKNPLEVVIQMPIGQHCLELTLDDSLDVIDTTQTIN